MLMIPFAFMILIPFLFIGFIALVIVLAIHGAKQREKRRQALSAMGTRFGLSFNPEKDRSFDDRYPFFDCLKTGSDRYAYNRLNGQFEGRSLVAFDYHYETSSTDSKGNRSTTSHHFSAVIFEVGLDIPGLVIRPEGMFDRLTRFFGFDDIDFESAEFSRQFFVKCRDRQMAYDVIQPTTMDQMLRFPRFNLHFDHGLVIIYRSQRFEPADFRNAIHLVDTILDGIPPSAREVMEARR